MVCTNLNLHYIGKLYCKYELFWLSGSGGEDFYMTPPHFCIFEIISPLKRTWPFIWTIQNSLYPRIIYDKFDWNWPAGSGEDFFFNIHKCKYGFPYCGPSRPLGTMMWTILNLHYIRSSHVNMTYSGSVVLKKKIFKWPNPISAFLWLSPLWREPSPWFVQFWIPFT